MSIHSKQLREAIVRPTLNSLQLYSKSAEELLMLTAAVESHCGEFLLQIEGPALGIYQMEPNTHDDIWKNYLSFRPDLASRVMQQGEGARNLIGNLYYATAMARVHYLRIPKPLPDAHDTFALANYWKAHYNTEMGSGRCAEAIGKYEKYAFLK